MKKIVSKFIKSISFVIFGLLVLTSCIIQTNKLNAPVVYLNENNYSIYWENVPYAISYEVYINDQLNTTLNSNVYQITDINDELYYEIKVKAYGDENIYAPSDFSNIITIGSKPVEDLTANFLMINDTHGAFIDDGTPGIDRVGGLLNELTKNGGDYIKIANGDIFQGSYVSNTLYGLPMVEALNTLEFDAFVLGNHEFDWGLDKIAQYKDGNLDNGELNCSILGANVVYKNTKKMVDFLEPYTVVENNGLKVGIIGVMGYGLESSILTSNVEDYQFLYPTDIVEEYAELLRKEQNCNIVVVAIHDFSESVNEQLAKLDGYSRIDAIFCGHTHQKLGSNDGVDVTRKDGVTIPVIQNYSQNVTAARVSLKLDDNYDFNSFISEHYYPSDYPKDSKLANVIKKYQTYINEGNRVLGATGKYLNEQTIGQLITDAMLENYDVDVAIFNTGGVRDTISYGNITVSDVYNVLPFNNIVYTTSLTGRALASLYNNNRYYLYLNSSFEYEKIDYNKIYRIAVIDYVFTSPYYKEFANVDYVNTNDLVRDIFINYIEKKY